MGELAYTINNNKLSISLEGRVDTNNASAVEEKINEIINNNSGYELVLDAEIYKKNLSEVFQLFPTLLKECDKIA